MNQTDSPQRSRETRVCWAHVPEPVALQPLPTRVLLDSSERHDDLGQRYEHMTVQRTTTTRLMRVFLSTAPATNFTALQPPGATTYLIEIADRPDTLDKAAPDLPLTWDWTRPPVTYTLPVGALDAPDEPVTVRISGTGTPPADLDTLQTRGMLAYVQGRAALLD